MSIIKERIIGAVSIMNEQDAIKVWDLIQATFSLSNVSEVKPEKEELDSLNAYHSGVPDYQPSYKQEDVIKELGL